MAKGKQGSESKRRAEVKNTSKKEDIQKTSGAGPAISKRSKDATKAPRVG